MSITLKNKTSILFQTHPVDPDRNIFSREDGKGLHFQCDGKSRTNQGARLLDLMILNFHPQGLLFPCVLVRFSFFFFLNYKFFFCRVGRGPIVKCEPSPGPRNPYNLDVMKPRAPAFTIMNRVSTPIRSEGPGPKYYVPPPKPVPMFSFGMKHSECSRPYITPCDDQC